MLGTFSSLMRMARRGAHTMVIVAPGTPRAREADDAHTAAHGRAPEAMAPLRSSWMVKTDFKSLQMSGPHG